LKPAWDQLGDTFASSSSVLVADVDCTSTGGKAVCEDFGVKGYPTVKYFTAESGEKGEDYKGGRTFEALKTFTEETLAKGCTIADPASCDEQEVAYIAKMTEKGKEESVKELGRLTEMLKTAKMATDKKQWMAKRASILKQM
jgi:protein disulfide-isomerase A6